MLLTVRPIVGHESSLRRGSPIEIGDRTGLMRLGDLPRVSKVVTTSEMQGSYCCFPPPLARVNAAKYSQIHMI